MVRWLLAALFAASIVGAGCTLFDADPPDDSCLSDNDCFRAQGERCVNHHCKVVTSDAGVDAP